jgi:hypothetical protein
MSQIKVTLHTSLPPQKKPQLHFHHPKHAVTCCVFTKVTLSITLFHKVLNFDQISENTFPISWTFGALCYIEDLPMQCVCVSFIHFHFCVCGWISHKFSNFMHSWVHLCWVAIFLPLFGLTFYNLVIFELKKTFSFNVVKCTTMWF